MGIMRIWCKVDNTKASPDNKVPCAIQDIKQGEMFGFFDFYCSGLSSSKENQWHYGIATKDSYQREDGVWVVEADELHTHVLEVS